MPATAVFDENILLKRLGNNRALLAELVQIFLEEGPRNLENIAEGITKNDLPAVRMASHTLKGSLDYFGIATAIALAETIEKQAKIGQLHEVAQNFGELEKVVRLLLAELRVVGS